MRTIHQTHRATRDGGRFGRALVLAAFLWLLPSAESAQENQAGGSKKGQDPPAPKVVPPTKKADDEKPDKSLTELDPLGAPGTAGSEEEMRELFLKVDKRLKRVSELLLEASTGDPSRAAEVGASGIDELIREAENAASGGAAGIGRILEASRSQSSAANDEIQRILEIAAQQPPPGSGGGSGQGPPSPGEGMPKQGQTPSGSKREDKGERPGESGEPQQQKPEGEEAGEGKPGEGDKPSDGGDLGGDQTNDEGPPPEEGERGPASDAQGNEEWGDLPVHLRRTFQNGVSDDVPPRYRDWVDSYYKRLNRGQGK